MTAYNGSAEDIVLITDFTDGALNSFVRELIDVYLPGLVRFDDVCGYGCSDHASWDSFGYRATFAFESRFDDSNPTIHTANDTLATFGNSAAHAAKFARLSAAFLVETSIDALFRDDFETGNTARWSNTIP